ncbi:protein N-terminal asparagine amidohydrolase isoform X2 [Carica papaya]|uniref:protein N-terminal asparagine amidohydrolase isoform X2 n=1 Tax=Carica papaya TaxID=3649 RepID=UPI000B8CD97D|nr:protein N-terminal asparagine amidohydrolase isoform X2 [Carica papaya]
MIFVGGDSFNFANSSSSSSSQGSNLLLDLMKHPILESVSQSFKSIQERKVSSREYGSEGLTKSKYVYIFQREYATVHPGLVDFVGTDEATTCVGLVIRNQLTGMTSVAHLDSPKVVDFGLTQMLSLIVDDTSDADLDVHLIGGFEDIASKHAHSTTGSERISKPDGYSFPLCTKIIESLQKRPENFHIKTLFVLGHNTKWDSQGNAYPIFHGFMSLKPWTHS